MESIFIPVAGFFAERMSGEGSSDERLAGRIGGASKDFDGELGRIGALESSESWTVVVDRIGLPRVILIGEGGAIETG